MLKTLKNKTKQKKLVLLLVDALLVLTVFIAAYLFRVVVYEGKPYTAVETRVSWLLLVAIVVHLLSFFVFELYSIEKNISRLQLLIQIFVAALISLLIIALLSYFFPEDKIGRILIILHLPLVVFLLYLWRVVYTRSYLKNIQPHNLLLIAPVAHKKKFIELLKNYPLHNHNLVKVVQPGRHYSYKKWHKLITENRIRTIVVADSLKGNRELARNLLQLKFHGITVYDYIKFYANLSGRLPVFSINEGTLVFSGQELFLHPSYYLKVKKVMDFTLASLGLILSLPLFILVSFLIFITSGRPVLFIQRRMGLNGKEFNLYKFRTMVVDAEKESGPVWSKKGDPRITAIGRFLRATRLDEIPQFITVLKGDMSFIGPRPIRRHFAEKLGEQFPYYNLRFALKPGITGWAQVNSEYPVTVEGHLEKLEYELYYMNNMGFLLDIYIVLKTFQTVIFRRGL